MTLRTQEIIFWKFQKNHIFHFYFPDGLNMAPLSSYVTPQQGDVGGICKVKMKSEFSETFRKWSPAYVESFTAHERDQNYFYQHR